VGHAGQISRPSDAAETEDFLAAVARISALEHASLVLREHVLEHVIDG
jgi:hypothetical protein